MNRRFGTRILFIFFAFAVACFGIKTAASFPVPAIELSINETFADPSGHSPNAELEGLHLQLAGEGHISVQKNIAQLYFSQAADVQRTVSLENFQIRTSSLLVKDYLSHIYPSHNFW